MKDLIGYEWTMEPPDRDGKQIADEGDKLLIVAKPKDSQTNNNRYVYEFRSENGTKIPATLGASKDWWAEKVEYPKGSNIKRKLLRGTVMLGGKPHDGKNPPPDKHPHHVWMIYPDYSNKFIGYIEPNDRQRWSAFDLVEYRDPSKPGSMNHDGTYHSGN